MTKPDVHGSCSRKNIGLFVGVSVKMLMPLVATGALVTDVQLASAPRLFAVYSPSPFVHDGQFKVSADTPFEMPMLDAVICSIGKVREEICTESIWPLK